MQNGNGRENELDDALEDSFPASDPVSMTQPQARHGKPKQHSRHAAQSAGAAADVLQNEIGKKTGLRIRPDYLWLGGTFVAGAIFALAARSAPSAFPRKSYGRRLLDSGEDWQNRIAGGVSGLQFDKRLRRKLDRLIDRLR